MNPSKITPALVGGATLGFLSSIPIVNCACCAYAVGGGMLASYLHLKDQPPRSQPDYGDSLLLGLLTAFVGATVTSVIGAFFSLAMGGASQLANTVENLPEGVPPEVADLLGNIAVSGGFSVISIFIGFFFYLALFAVLAVVGTLIGASVFTKKTS